jgi:methionine sulfoxide reductase heme-binding subunit
MAQSLNPSIPTVRWFKPFVFLGCLGPLIRLAWKGFHAQLGANPIEVITHSTGDWTLIFLLVTLSVTPLRKLSRQLWLIRYRRMFGLFAFFYGTLHFLTYIWLDKFFDLHEMLVDIAKRKFITVGFTAFVLMIPLALTSTAGWIRRLGGRRWNLLHRLIYFTAIGGVIHYLWLVKADIRKPVEYGIVLAVLMSYRAVAWFRSKNLGKKGLPLPPQSVKVSEV